MAKGACVVGVHGEGGMHGGGYVWQGDMCGSGACVAWGNAWWGGTCVQERHPLKQAVCVLLECILIHFKSNHKK